MTASAPFGLQIGGFASIAASDLPPQGSSALRVGLPALFGTTRTMPIMPLSSWSTKWQWNNMSPAISSAK